MKLVLSGNLHEETTIRVLTDLRKILPITDVETSIHRSSDLSSGFQMIGDVSEWTSPLGPAASSFLTEHRQRSPGKRSPRPADSPLSSTGEELSPLRLVARSLAELLEANKSHELRIRLGIPAPDRRFGTNLVLREGDENVLALSIASLIDRLTDLEAFIRNELSGPNESTGPVDVTPMLDGSLVVRWLDAATLKYHETALDRSPAPNDS
jgi:hypothetical protein